MSVMISSSARRQLPSERSKRTLRVAHHAPAMDQQRAVAGEPARIAGKARHDRPRRRGDQRLAEEPHVPAVSLPKRADFLGQPSSYLGVAARAVRRLWVPKRFAAAYN